MPEWLTSLAQDNPQAAAILALLGAIYGVLSAYGLLPKGFPGAPTAKRFGADIRKPKPEEPTPATERSGEA